MKRILLPSVLAVVAAVTAACDKSGDGEADAGAPTVARVEAVGVQVELPGGWSYKERHGAHWVNRSLAYGAMLEKVDAMPASLADAKKTWMEGKVVDEGERAGDFFAVVDVEFGGKDSMVLPMVYFIAPIGDAAVQCSGQLQPGDDPKPLLDVCASMKAL